MKMGSETFTPIVLKKWKNFEFQWITHPSQYSGVLKNLHENFFRSTPLTCHLDYSKEYFEEFDKVYLHVLPQKLSFCAVDIETGEIAGVRVTFIHDRDLDRALENMNFKTPQMKVMNKIMGTVNKNSKIYERFGVDSFVNFYTACVSDKYRGQGLATAFYEEALKFVRSREDFHYVKSNITSPYTRRICENFGFTELARVYYNDFKDEEGNPILKGASDEDFVNFMVLKLR